jgi:hypothetical protein
MRGLGPAHFHFRVFPADEIAPVFKSSIWGAICADTLQIATLAVFQTRAGVRSLHTADANTQSLGSIAFGHVRCTARLTL